MRKGFIPIVLASLAILAFVGIWSSLGNKANEPSVSDSSPIDTGAKINQENEPQDPKPETNIKIFEIQTSNFKFSISEIRVSKGDKVRIALTNDQGFHDFVLDEFNIATAQLQAGQTDTIEFVADKQGVFEYYCSVGNHRQLGMIGTLVVE